VDVGHVEVNCQCGEVRNKTMCIAFFGDSISITFFQQNGDTPLLMAVRKGHFKMVKYLVDVANANILIENAVSSIFYLILFYSILYYLIHYLLVPK
jgi:hypothetical protein